MSDGRYCITTHESMGAVHRVDRPFPCRRRGIDQSGVRIPDAHYATCENDQCRGCVPRSARFGYLCPVCYHRLLGHLPKLADLIAHLRSIMKPPQPLGERVATSMEQSVLMPDTWTAADELLTAMGNPVIPSTASIDESIRIAQDAVAGFESTLDARLNTIDGATQAVILLKKIETALKRWPDSDAEFRHIPGMWCPACSWDNLWRQGPAKKGDDERVICTTEGCGYRFPYVLWAKQFAPRFEYLERDMKQRQKEARTA